jgi:SAGA-associated factor 11
MESSEEKKLVEQTEFVLNGLINDAIVRLCAETHRSVALGYDQWTSDGNLSDQDVVNVAGFDVFGQQQMKKSVECACPNCDRVIAVSRVAPHLEKCMGMGRNRRRLARRPVAYTDRDAGSGEEDDGEEWNVRQSQRKMKSQRV